MPRRVNLLVLVVALSGILPLEADAAGGRGKLAPALVEAIEALRAGSDPAVLRGRPRGVPLAVQPALPGRAARPFVRPDGRLQVHLTAAKGGDAAAVADAVRRHGGRVERVHEASGLVQATLAPDAVESLATDAAVASVRPPRYAFSQAGRVLTLGAGSPNTPCLPGGGVCRGGVNALAARVGYGAGGYSPVRGDRIRIGVVSDGIAGFGQSVLGGDLPADVTVRAFVDPPGDQIRDSTCTPTAEGRALLEIVHDLVPDAALYFAAVETDLDYLAAVEWLASEVDVIVDDIAFFNAGPYDGGSDVARVRTAASDAGVVYVAAVGNSGLLHHRSDFEPDADAGRPGLSHVAHRFPTGEVRMPVRVSPGGQAVVFLQWSGTPFERPAVDFDLIAFASPSGEEAADVSDAPQTGEAGQTPTESVVLDNTGGDETATFWLQIDYCGPFVNGACTGAEPPSGVTFRIFAVGAVAGGALEAPYRVPAGSVPNGPDAARIVTVGAVNVASGALRAYSSRGMPDVTDAEVKPTVVGPDGVRTTVGNDAGLGGDGNPSGFLGTSAAAPHVGAVAAMILAASPGRSPREVRDALIAAASADTPDNARGFGLVDAVAAIERVVRVDPAFAMAPLDPGLDVSSAPPNGRVVLVGFTLANGGAAPLVVRALTASARLGDTPGTEPETATTGHERADLTQACVVDFDAPATTALGCARFAADDGRLLVVLDPPLTLPPGGARRLALAYDLAVQPAGTTVVAHRAAPAAALAVFVAVAALGRRRSCRRLLVAAVAGLPLACGGGDGGGPAGGDSGAVAEACPPAEGADALSASEQLEGGTATFAVRPLERGDVIAVDAAGRPTVPTLSGAVAGRRVTVARP